MERRVKSYLAIRRKLGFAMKEGGDLLTSFAKYADRSGHHGALTIDLAVQWAKLPTMASPSQWARRLGIVRQFARYESAIDPKTQIPPMRLLGTFRRRIQPHIYSDHEIASLIRAAGELAPVGSLRPLTYSNLFGLLASTGLRISEALRLNRTDVDITGSVLTVTRTKFHKSRLVPLHPSTTRALSNYTERRNRYCPLPKSKAFFLSNLGTRPKYRTVNGTFVKLRHRLGWVGYGTRRPPRIHDIRHSFACRRLLAWYREGGDINVKLPALSTYLGHVGVSHTYWYLTAVPDLMAAASERFELHAGEFQ
jgi:integrase